MVQGIKMMAMIDGVVIEVDVMVEAEVVLVGVEEEVVVEVVTAEEVGVATEEVGEVGVTAEAVVATGEVEDEVDTEVAAVMEAAAVIDMKVVEVVVKEEDMEVVVDMVEGVETLKEEENSEVAEVVEDSLNEVVQAVAVVVQVVVVEGGDLTTEIMKEMEEGKNLGMAATAEAAGIRQMTFRIHPAHLQIFLNFPSISKRILKSLQQTLTHERKEGFYSPFDRDVLGMDGSDHFGYFFCLSPF